MVLHRGAMLKRIYDWCIDAAHKPYALWIMGAVAFAESSFFPVPPDVMLIPMSLARPSAPGSMRRSARSTSVLGGLLGYAIGALLYRLGRALADPALWPRRQGRCFPRLLCGVGRGDHPAQGPDADPLQARHHHLGLCRLQSSCFSSCARSSRAAGASSSWRSCSTAMATGSGTSSRSISACGWRLARPCWCSASWSRSS